jgi:hypothetical protein
MFPDEIVFSRSVPATIGSGANRPTYALLGESAASVQSNRVDRVDAQGRSYSISLHEVYTPTNIGVRTADRIEWTDRSGASHVLSVESGTVPKGIGDVSWCTYCVETR